MSGKPVEVTWERVEPLIVHDDSGCWFWLGPVDNGDIAYLTSRNRRVNVARWLYRRHYGHEFPRRALMLRKCGTRDCIRPEHMGDVHEKPQEHRVLGYCRNGHPRTKRNLYIYGNEKYQRCLACKRNARRKANRLKRSGRTIEESRQLLREAALKAWERRRREGWQRPNPSRNHPWRRLRFGAQAR